MKNNEEIVFAGEDVVDPGNDSHPSTVYTPFVTKDGRVGYRATRVIDGKFFDTYIYFNPSDTSEDLRANVFIYIGAENDPNLDGTAVFVPLDSHDFKAVA